MTSKSKANPNFWLGLLLLTSVFACAVTKGSEATAPDEVYLPGLTHESELADSRARELYGLHCSLCHGEEGRGDGDASAWLYPPARDFGLGQFRIVSGKNAYGGGGPTIEDLVKTLERGMPGSGMPSFAWMPRADLVSLSELVMEMSMNGMVESMHEIAVAEGDSFDQTEARMIAARWLRPGEPIGHLPALDPTPEVLARGQSLYADHCASCHGMDGKGQSGSLKQYEDGSLTWARDFTAGILKGGGSRLDLTRRIRAGMPGSSMPPTDLPNEELAALVGYVQRLIPSGAPERHVQVRTRLHAPYIEVPEPQAGDWRAVEEIELHMAPLAWSDLSVLDVRVSALHNGERLWIRMSWADATREDRPIGGSPYADGAAIQITEAPAPPLFGMGAAGHPVNIWHWKPASWSEIAGALDPIHIRSAHGGQIIVDELGKLDVPVHQPVGESPQVGRSLDVEGFGQFTELPGGVEASSIHANGRWEVVYSRALDASGPADVDLVIGRIVQFACAVWNGAAGDQRGNKSITIWHELELGS